MVNKRKFINIRPKNAQHQSNLNDLSPLEKRKSKNDIEKNPDLFYFIKSNVLIYEPLHSSYFFEKIADKNSKKLNKNELDFLDSFIDSIKNSRQKSIIYVLPFFHELINYIVPCESNITERTSVIKNYKSQNSSQVSKLQKNIMNMLLQAINLACAILQFII